MTVKLQDSSDNISFADITGTSLTTTALTTAHTAVRVTVPNTTTIRRYIAVATVGTAQNSHQGFAVSSFNRRARQHSCWTAFKH